MADCGGKQKHNFETKQHCSRFEDRFVTIMTANPEPAQALGALLSDHTISQADTSAPENSHFLLAAFTGNPRTCRREVSIAEG